MIKSADLFFTTSESFISKFIRFRTWGKYSHVQIIVETEPILGVISADVTGVTWREIRKDELDSYAILTCPTMTDKEREDVVKFCFSTIGTPYDYWGLVDFLLNTDLQEEDHYFCSELAFIGYEKAGKSLLKRIDHAFVSPMHLYISPILEVVEEKGGG
jgi:uncharacterized protein YycO